MHLAENIHEYYFAHLNDLTEEKQFHLCSRLAAWNKDSQALSFLAAYQKHYVPTPITKTTLQARLEHIINNPPLLPANAAKLRDKYFERYPWLRGLELALFRVRHWGAIYGIDARPALFDIIPRQQLVAYKNQLLSDEEGLRFLSTYAINYLYILERVILQHTEKDAIDVSALRTVALGYNTEDVLHLQLLAYYYTHCIIGESNFYISALPLTLLPEYTKMLATLDAIIEAHFESLSLDTKLEFLVCCRLCDYTSAVTAKINDECRTSISPVGTFIIDTHNTFAGRVDKQSLDASEHRNVLFIMANLPRII